MTAEQRALLDSLNIQDIEQYLGKRRKKNLPQDEHKPECPFATYCGEKPCDYHTMSGCTWH